MKFQKICKRFFKVLNSLIPIKVQTRSLAISSLFCLFLFASSAHEAVAQPSKSLFSGKAAEKAIRRHYEGSDSKFSSYGNSLREAATLDSVADILEENPWSRKDIFALYRGPFYLSYVYDIISFPDFDSKAQKADAEKLAIYQASMTFSKLVIGSALEPVYRDMIKSLKWFREYTSLKVSKNSGGGVAISDGNSKQHPLVEFKLHVSANNGVEPRINIGQGMSLRYDVIRQDTLLEFKCDF